MRTLTAGMLAAIAKTITNPVFLIQVDFGSKIVRATTREEIIYNTNEYNYVGAQILDINSNRVRFSLLNFDREISALALAGQIQGNAVDIFLHYEGETIGRFSGLLDSPTFSGDYNTAGFSCVSEYSLSNKWPADRLRPPVANHLPTAGTVLYIGPWEIELERDLG